MDGQTAFSIWENGRDMPIKREQAKEPHLVNTF
jgi:hypothetical protein